MNKPNTIDQEIIIQSIHLKYLKFEMVNGEHNLTLIDLSGYEIVKGYGKTLIDAINDLHHNLI